MQILFRRQMEKSLFLCGVSLARKS